MKKTYIILGISLVCIFLIGMVGLLVGIVYIAGRNAVNIVYSEPAESREIVVEMKTLEPPHISGIPEGGHRVTLETPGSDLEKPPTLFTLGVYKMNPNPENSRELLDKDLNTYYVNSRAWPLDDPKKSNDLKRQLTEMGQHDPDQTIIISIGPNAYQYKLIQILKVCKKAGFKNLFIVPDDDGIKFQPYGKKDGK